MDKPRILSALNLPPTTAILVRSLEMVMWGRNLLFFCEANHIEFELHFKDCREMRWQIYTHMQHDKNPAFPPTQLANCALGRGQHRSPAHLLTEHFGLSLVYGEVYLLRDDEKLSLATWMT